MPDETEQHSKNPVAQEITSDDGPAEITEKAGAGEPTPQPAGAEADDLGSGSLAARLDPLLGVAWTLPMGVAWITWRNLEAVREQEPRRASLTLLLLSQEDDDPSSRMTTFQARHELWGHLIEGRLCAEGVDTETRRPVVIPALDWRYLSHQGDDRRPNSVRFLNQDRRPDPRGYDDVVVRRADVLRLWPETSAVEQEQDAFAAEPEKEKKRRRSAKKAAFLVFLKALYPKGIPPHVTDSLLANQYEHWRVNDPAARAMNAETLSRPGIRGIRKSMAEQEE